MRVVVWHNGRSFSDEVIGFFDYAPLTQDHVAELVDLLKSLTWSSDQFILGFADYEPRENPFEYGVVPLSEMIDNYIGHCDKLCDGWDDAKFDQAKAICVKFNCDLQAY